MIGHGEAWWWAAAAAEQEPSRYDGGAGGEADHPQEEPPGAFASPPAVILACHCMRYQDCDVCREPVQESRDERSARIMGSDAERDAIFADAARRLFGRLP